MPFAAGGQIDVVARVLAAVMTHKRFGVATAARIKTLPQTPMLAEPGLKGFDVAVRHGIYAPKGTPKEATAKFGAAMRAALKAPAVVAKMDELGAVIVPESKQTPAGLQTGLQQATARYAPVIKAAGQFADGGSGLFDGGGRRPLPRTRQRSHSKG